MDWLEFFKKEWGNLMAAPWAFVGTGVIGTVAGFAIATTLFLHELAGVRADRDYYKSQVEHPPKPPVPPSQSPAKSEARRTCFDYNRASPAERSIADTFKRVAAERYDELGNPTDCVQELRESSRAVFDRAMEIWTLNNRRMYFMFRAPDRWMKVSEGPECDAPWAQPSNEPAREAHFSRIYSYKRPRGDRAPYGGTACFIDSHREYADKIGWQVTQCEHIHATFEQPFEKGDALGVFRTNYDDPDGQVVAFYANGSWDAFDTGTKVPSCGDGSFGRNGR